MHFPPLLLVLISVVVSRELNTTFHLQGEKGPQYFVESIASPPPGQGQNGTSVPRSPPDSAKEDSVPECADEISHDTSFDWAFVCPRADSLYKLFERFKRENHRMRVKITVKKVDGPLRLQPPPRIIIISLFLQNANVTRISNEAQNLSSLSSLSRLDLRNNPLLELEYMQWMSVLSSLTVLSLRETPVTELALTLLMPYLPALQHLDISSSGLRFLPEKVFDKNPELQLLDLSNNEFGKLTLPGSLTLRLTHLNISSCQLDKVSVLTACVEGPCPTPSSQGRLRILDVSNNYLKWLPRRLVESLEKNAVVNIKENRWNEACHRCPLYYLWQYSRQALYIDAREDLDCFSEAVLRRCGWEDCPTECDCDRERNTVNCTGKGLVELPIVVPSETEIFLADNNDITNIDNLYFPTYCNLKQLSVERNLVTELLLTVKGKCNCPTDGDYYREESNCYPLHLHTVSLDDNKIKRLTAADCSLLYPLRTLTMSRNKLENPGAQVCGSLQHLRSLDLSHNRITNVTSHDLATYPFLRDLNLSHNALEKLPPNITELAPRLKTLNVVSTCISNLTSGTSGLSIINENISMMNCGRHDQGAAKEEPGTPEKKSVKAFMVAIAVFVIVIIFLYVCSVCVRHWCSPGGYTTKEIEDTSECKYSVFVVHSSKDREMVRENLIIPLFQRGYSVAWHENAFVPGAWILENIERAVRNSERMVVFATDNLTASRCSLQEIRRGRYEEMDREEFRVMALVTETLPRALAKDLYEIVALRTHIHYSDRDYIEKICQFLRPPRPVPVQDTPPLHATSIRSHLDRFDEMRRGHKKQNMSEVVYLHRDDEGYVIDQCTASITKGARVSPWSQMSQGARVQMLLKYTKSPGMPSESYAETRSLNYVLLDQKDDDNEDEDSFQLGTSSRFFITRTSCRF
ncbi:uncharacterized protein LOC125041771 [Penaeus chinensis]|uniref:uncharacterized protein LOC125041771 n=1 Tax=Penaeus chinensis TaxID=139456 RepID=UPI001FB588E3|nr:uncharacterized protein LOC125041771 [Penaeus chinensis]